MKKILCLLCIFLSTYAFSQHSWTEGTLYLKNGTVKTGLLKFPQVSKDLIAFNGKQKVKFKKNKKAKKQKYDHKQVDKVVFSFPDSDEATYVYIAVAKKKYELFEKIVEGKATLYARSVSYTRTVGHDFMTNQPVFYDFNDYDEFYVKKESENIASPLITLRISRSFKKRAMEYFANCPGLVAKLKDKTYRKEDIKEVVTIYNNCK